MEHNIGNNTHIPELDSKFRFLNPSVHGDTHEFLNGILATDKTHLTREMFNNLDLLMPDRNSKFDVNIGQFITNNNKMIDAYERKEKTNNSMTLVDALTYAHRAISALEQATGIEPSTDSKTANNDFFQIAKMMYPEFENRPARRIFKNLRAVFIEHADNLYQLQKESNSSTVCIFYPAVSEYILDNSSETPNYTLQRIIDTYEARYSTENMQPRLEHKIDKFAQARLFDAEIHTNIIYSVVQSERQGELLLNVIPIASDDLLMYYICAVDTILYYYHNTPQS